MNESDTEEPMKEELSNENVEHVEGLTNLHTCCFLEMKILLAS